MRNALAQLAQRSTPDHAGLAYDVWAPLDANGAIPDNERPGWLDTVCGIGEPAGYQAAFRRWKGSFHDDGVTSTAEVELASRLLLGHGNASPTEVGLTLHHTWGVPVLPGSALKGLTAHYVETTYGKNDPDWRGVQWDEDTKRIVGRPGVDYAELFGAPDADESDEPMLQGCVLFHDALWRRCKNDPERPLAPDVLTVHQSQYYRTQGQHWPNDYDSPIPVSFLTVRPGTKFLLAVSGANGWGELAMRFLLEALELWGIGGKTTSGYGRIKPGAKIVGPTVKSTPETERLLNLIANWTGTKSELLAEIEDRLQTLAVWPPEQRGLVRAAVAKAITRRDKNAARLDRVLTALQTGVIPPDEDASPAGSPELAEFLGWLSGQAADEAALTAIENAWLVRLGALAAEEKAHAVAAIQQHFAGSFADRIAVLAELLS